MAGEFLLDQRLHDGEVRRGIEQGRATVLRAAAWTTASQPFP